MACKTAVKLHVFLAGAGQALHLYIRNNNNAVIE